jgi:DNA modification methylase
MSYNITTYNNDCFLIFPQISDKSIDCVLTDIPYGQVNRRSNGLRNFNKVDADIETFKLAKFLYEINRICKGSVYIFCATEQCSEIRSTLIDYNFSTRHCCWVKTNPSPINGQYIWLSAIENCIYGKRPKSTFNEHCKPCVWMYSSSRNKFHPTEKPLKLFEYLIKVSTNEGDLILDPCVGSGTTAIACKNLNRNCIAIEKNKDYYNIMLERLNNG